MKRKILFVLILLCGIFVYAGPFGLSMGMTYDEVQEACGGRAPERIENDDRYYITPEKSHSMFKIYIAWISDEFGLYYIRAVSDEIYTNQYGEEIKNDFYSFKNRIENIYGKPEIIDKIIDPNCSSFYKDNDYWLRSLEKGARELSASWNIGNKDVVLKDNLYRIKLWVSYIKYDKTVLIIDYGFINHEKVENKEDEVL